MKRRTVTKGLLFLSLGSLAGVLWWHSLPPTYHLLDHSTYVMSLAVPNPPGVTRVIGWLSDHEILFCYLNPAQRSNAYLVFDTALGTTRTLTALNQKLGKKQRSPIALSPNRQWLLLHKGYTSALVAPLDGSRLLRVNHPNLEDVWWQRDGKGLLCWDKAHKQLLSWPLSRLTQVQRLPMPGLSGDTYLRGVSQDGLLAARIPIFQDRSVDLVPLQFQQNRFTAKHFAVAIPEKGEVVSIQPAPQGDRLVWCVSYSRKQFHLPLLGNLFPQFKANKRMLKGFWISRLDGTGMREVGHVEARGVGNPNIGDWGWLPDGKHLWYEYDERLWRVLVPD